MNNIIESLKTCKNESELRNNDDNKGTEQITSVGKLIKNICIEKEISFKKLCNGICTESFFSEFTSGQKSVNMLILDLLFQRLGRSEDEFEIYLMPREYERIKMRFKIVDLIEKKEIKKSEDEIEKYKKLIVKNDKFHERFLLIMKARIMHLQNESYEKIYLTLKEAVEKTVPKFEEKQLDELILSYNELFFMIECMKFREKAYKDNKSQEFYLKLINYIEESDFDYINKAKIYPKVVCLVAKNQMLNKQFDYIKEKCDTAIYYLRKSRKLYFIKELLETISYAIKGKVDIYKSQVGTLENALENLNKLESALVENEKERVFITELFDKYNLGEDPFEWYPHNHVREIYPVGEVIKRRREMQGISIEDFSNATGYSVKTIKRVESGEKDSYPVTAKELLKAVGMFGELQVYAFDSNSYDDYKLEKELLYYFILGKYKEANEFLEKLENEIYTLNKLNKQYIGHVKTAILNNLGKISNEEAIQKYIEALKITIPIQSIFSDKKKYFTKREIMLIYNIGMAYNRDKDNKNALKWLGIFENYYNDFDFDLSNYIITYELIMSGYQSLLGDMGEYNKSDKLSQKALYESLKCRRGGFIVNFLYSSAWNMKEKIENGNKKMQLHELALYKDKIEKALMISCIVDDKRIMDFLENKLMEVRHNYQQP